MHPCRKLCLPLFCTTYEKEIWNIFHQHYRCRHHILNLCLKSRVRHCCLKDEQYLDFCTWFVFVAVTLDDELNLETLQICSHIIHAEPTILEKHKTEIMTYCWHHLKRDDSAARYHAFHTMCRYFEHYTIVEKTGYQVCESRQICILYALWREIDANEWLQECLI